MQIFHWHDVVGTVDSTPFPPTMRAMREVSATSRRQPVNLDVLADLAFSLERLE
jgi:hypothetical protein